MHEADFDRLAQSARNSAAVLFTASRAAKDGALYAVAAALRAQTDAILTANAQDVAAAADNGIRPVMIDRLRLTAERIEQMAASVEAVAALPDPVGTVLSMQTRPNGLKIGKQRVPLGVVGLIYESRPNVTVDAAVLCLKAGNACILRGGREALCSNQILATLMREAIAAAGLPADAVNLLADTDRSGVQQMMRARGKIDVLIPRGGAGLIRTVLDGSSVPVIETGVGICHVYVHASADPAMAVSIVDNAKTSRPSVCNAAEVLLIDRAAAGTLLPQIHAQLAAHQVAWRGCAETCAILGDRVQRAEDGDYETEFNDYILACRVVGGLEEAVAHINAHGSHHSDAIVTESYTAAQRFLAAVDSAAVYVNASTRFTDGGEFGEGAEIGISTQKMHVRGPFGLEALTSVKYIVYGSGQVR